MSAVGALGEIHHIAISESNTDHNL